MMQKEKLVQRSGMLHHVDSQRPGLGRAMLVVVFALVLLLASAATVSAAVEMLSFTGADSENGVELVWETATEIKVAGFYVNRGSDPETMERISDFIPAQGDSITGSTYSYTDADGSITDDTYFIEVINLDETIDMIGPAVETSQDNETRVSLPLVVR